ncbi:MAG: hypothetical protein ACRC7O_15135 [Fimbriiglobus sp.]
MMYPSGEWDGFWQQTGYGKQPMVAFVLYFREGSVAGRGVDIVGPFTFSGTVDERNGRVELVKQYLGKHRVSYVGDPDGEGSIGGTWHIPAETFGVDYSGSFRIRPVLPRLTGEEPIREIG